jgi:hypothetical protein
MVVGVYSPHGVWCMVYVLIFYYLILHTCGNWFYFYYGKTGVVAIKGIQRTFSPHVLNYVIISRRGIWIGVSWLCPIVLLLWPNPLMFNERSALDFTDDLGLSRGSHCPVKLPTRQCAPYPRRLSPRSRYQLPASPTIKLQL